MTSHATPTTEGLLLPGLDGSNPLGFLAALGTFQTIVASQPHDRIKMAWNGSGIAWNPVIYGLPSDDLGDVAKLIAEHLGCPFKPKPSHESIRADAQKRFDDSKKALKDAMNALKTRRLRGKERENAEKRKLDPLRQRVEKARDRWLDALKHAVPSVELCLGKHLNARVGELRDVCTRALPQASLHHREVIDLLVSFGSDACGDDKTEQMRATPFCFVTGSGHQYFLDTVRQLAENVDAARIHAALSGMGEPRDEKLSLRWNPTEDRRYALMAADPTASGNKTLTNWALNLLGYRGLQLLPAIPTTKGLQVAGWSRSGAMAWRWPIWGGRLKSDVIRSLLSMEILSRGLSDPATLLSCGIEAVYQTERIQVGNPPLQKINFAPARRIA